MWALFSRDPSRDFPYELGEPWLDHEERCLWKMHRGKKKGSEEEVSIFVLAAKGSSAVQMEQGKAALKRLKTLRHPGVLTYIDSLESSSGIQVVTEPVDPLLQSLKCNDEASSEGMEEQMILWGLFQITRVLKFLQMDGGLSHNNINAASIFVSRSGEWKLGGFEYVRESSGGSGEGPSPLPPISPTLQVYQPPERNASAGGKVPVWAADAWGLGCLMWEAFNGLLGKTQALKNPGKIPQALVPTYCQLVSSKPSSRPSPESLLQRNPFSCSLQKDLQALEELSLQESGEASRFCSDLQSRLDSFPLPLCRLRILPQLLAAAQFGKAGAVALPAALKIGHRLKDKEREAFESALQPCLQKLFDSPERSTRLRLLQLMDQLAPLLSKDALNKNVFPKILQGLSDSNPALREQTVKAVLPLAPNLSYENLNVELLREFARIQAKDEEGGIRTNTTVCLGKLAPYLAPSLRPRVLVSAFSRAFRDPFPPTRQAGVLGLAATQHLYTVQEVAARLIPVLAPLTVDPERSVRDSVFRTLRAFLDKLEKVSLDPALREQMDAEAKAGTGSVAESASSWAGWAVSAVTSKLYRPKGSSRGNTPSPAISPSDSQPSSLDHKEESRRGSLSQAALFPDKTSNPAATSDEVSRARSLYDVKYGAEREEVEDGWDNEDWGSLEMDKPMQIETNKEEKEENTGWDVDNDDVDWAPLEEDLGPKKTGGSDVVPTSQYTWGEDWGKDDPFFQSIPSQKFGSTLEDSSSRQKGLNKKGPMKLGIKRAGF